MKDLDQKQNATHAARARRKLPRKSPNEHDCPPLRMASVRRASTCRTPPRTTSRGFLRTYVFSRDHKVIGIQFLFSTLLWFFVGGLLALAVRWQLAWPWTPMPVIGHLLSPAEGGQMSPEFYTMLFTMHATIMIFFVIIPILAGAFGNFLIPLMIGADDMAFPDAEHVQLLVHVAGVHLLHVELLRAAARPAAGWTSYPPLSDSPVGGARQRQRRRRSG